METAVKESLLQELAAIEVADAPAAAAKAHPNQDLETFKVGPYTVLAMLGLIQRAAKQLKSELKGNDWPHLPNELNSRNLGNTNLQDVLAQLRTYLQQSTTFDSVLPYLQALISHQMLYGYWDRSRQKVHDGKAIELDAKAQALDALTKQLAAQRQELEEGRVLLQTEKVRLEEFYGEKDAQFQRLSSQQSQGASLLQEINQFHTSGSTVSAKLDALLQTQQTHLATIEDRQVTEQDAFEEFKAEHDELRRGAEREKTLFENKKQEFDGHLVFAQETEEFLQAKRDEINKLTAFAADGALGHSFNLRRDTLNSTVLFWRWAVGISALFTLAWMLLIFSGGFGHFPHLAAATTSPWLNLLLNALKTSPIVLLLLFSIKQYNRERNLQEEYAFRAAVAMTISAYADKLTTEDNKEKIIMESVQRVYTSPRISAHDSGFGLRLPSKEVGELLKNLTEAVKELKSTK